MTHYVVSGDVLNTFFGAPLIGTVVYMPTQSKIPWFLSWSVIARLAYGIENHGMDAVLKSLAEYNKKNKKYSALT